MRIGVVGGGIAGLATAFLLQEEHDVTLFEAAPRVGGHAHTLDVEHEGSRFAVDTGFVVYNEVTYPNFVALLARLGVATQPTEMSFSVRNERSGLEYCGTGFNSIFAQRRNLLRPRFHRMLRDIVRFNRTAEAEAGRLGERATLAELLAAGNYGQSFIDDYFVPMTAAIWSTPAAEMTAAPALFIVRFLRNHGMLSVNGHFEWRTVAGGSRRYVDALVARLRKSPETATPIAALLRRDDHVEVVRASGRKEIFDEVVLAVHTDEARLLLADADREERNLLADLRYETSAVTVHRDSRLLPRAPRARASWNYHADSARAAKVTLTYDMSRLQRLETTAPILVTLNRDESIDPSKVFARFEYSHPQYDLRGAVAKARLLSLSGTRRIHFAGAWCGNGFHEDGVVSAHAVAERLRARRAA
ncbi:MAG: FAD-dependent oxidoreductase [Thermoanaerobaculia bacterium]